MERSYTRKDERKKLVMDVDFKAIRSDIQTVKVTNLSEGGCQLFCPDLQLKIDNRVMLRPESFENFLGTVTWAIPGMAGISFDVPLHPAIVDHLCARHSLEPATLDFTCVS